MASDQLAFGQSKPFSAGLVSKNEAPLRIQIGDNGRNSVGHELELSLIFLESILCHFPARDIRVRYDRSPLASLKRGHEHVKPSDITGNPAAIFEKIPTSRTCE